MKEDDRFSTPTPSPRSETSRTSITAVPGAVANTSVIEASVYKVGMKLPPFWPEEPALWFAQVEGQFAITGISADTTKFFHVIAQLDHQYATEVKDIITSPPPENKYAKLKTELIKRLSASQEKKIKQFLMHEELGDRKPSQFLRHLQTLAGPAIPDAFLRTLWSSRLPHNIQTVIASQADVALETVADLADKFSEIAPVTQVATASADYSMFTELQKQIVELTREPSKQPCSPIQSQIPKWRFSQTHLILPSERHFSNDVKMPGNLSHSFRDV